jgi:hypothetical protein
MKSSFRKPTATTLVLLLHHECATLLVAKVKFRHGGGFDRLLIRRLNGPKILPEVDAAAMRDLGRAYVRFGSIATEAV